MPLVSGVCRAASAPMLSHGGSRLNASKPEANPKTSCPFFKQHFEKESGAVCSEPSFSAENLLETLRMFGTRLLYPMDDFSLSFRCGVTTSVKGGVSKHTSFFENTQKIESPLKRLQHSAVSVARST
jgi:uncharacterized protein YkuJ